MQTCDGVLLTSWLAETELLIVVDSNDAPGAAVDIVVCVFEFVVPVELSCVEPSCV